MTLKQILVGVTLLSLVTGCISERHFGLARWPGPPDGLKTPDKVAPIDDSFRRLRPKECIKVAVECESAKLSAPMSAELGSSILSALSSIRSAIEKSPRYSRCDAVAEARCVVTLVPSVSRTKGKERLSSVITLKVRDVKDNRSSERNFWLFEPRDLIDFLDKFYEPELYIMSTYSNGRYAVVDAFDCSKGLADNEMVQLFTHERGRGGVVEEKVVGYAIVLDNGEAPREGWLVGSDGSVVDMGSLPAGAYRRYCNARRGYPILEIYDFKWRPARAGLCVRRVIGNNTKSKGGVK